jgi:RsiW-degrading membrane proteinase PrsW (M82 family)
MVIMIVLAQLYGVFQLSMLGWSARSVRWMLLFVAMLAGLSATSAFSIIITVGLSSAYAAISGKSSDEVTDLIGYTIGPFAEEIVKLLPVIVVFAVFEKVRRRWGNTDLVLMSAAVGAGFGLADQLVRFGDAQARARGGGGWLIPDGPLVSQVVPGPKGLLTYWLPAGVGQVSVLSQNAAQAINVHLVWSAIAGLGLALILRYRHPHVRLLGASLIFLVGLDHAAYNSQGKGLVARQFAEPFLAAEGLVWLFPLIALGVAVLLDRQVVERGLRA